VPFAKEPHVASVLHAFRCNGTVAFFPSGLRLKCVCKKNCVERFLGNPERASLFEMWMEQMTGRTLHEQNVYLFNLVRKVKTPCDGATLEYPRVQVMLTSSL